MTNSLSQPYKSKDFKIFLSLMEATGLEPVTAITLLLFQLSYASIWKWALSINPLEAIIVLAILSDVKIIKNYPIVTVTVDNTTILHCQFFTEIG